MANGWHLVHNEDGWAEYKRQVEQELGGDVVQWGSGPSEFPCLATSFSPRPGKVVSCYVFLGEAVKLIQAAGHDIQVDSGPVTAVNTVGPEQSEFNKSIWAHVRALIKICKDIGVIKSDDDYQRAYDVALSEVDQDEAEQSRSLLDGLNTDEDEDDDGR
jgi:hypothetical protein